MEKKMKSRDVRLPERDSGKQKALTSRVIVIPDRVGSIARDQALIGANAERLRKAVLKRRAAGSRASKVVSA